MTTLLDVTVPEENETVETACKKLGMTRRALKAGIQLPARTTRATPSLEEQRNSVLEAGLSPQEIDALGFTEEAVQQEQRQEGDEAEFSFEMGPHEEELVHPPPSPPPEDQQPTDPSAERAAALEERQKKRIEEVRERQRA